MTSWLSLMVVLTPLLLHAQRRTDIVVDKESGAPLPYVHIGVVEKNVGAISRVGDKSEATPCDVHRTAENKW